MTAMASVSESFIKWCTRQKWNLVFALVLPETAPAEEFDQSFRLLIRELEMADGTLDFRWIRLIPSECEESLRVSYILVGGLSAGEWWFWIQRWKAMNQRYPDAHGGILYSSRRRGMHLKSTLREVFQGGTFSVEMQFGARFIQRRRKLMVDEDSFPVDKKLRRMIANKEVGGSPAKGGMHSSANQRC